MTAHELLSLLDGVKSRGTGKWSARCPAHPDNNPSLSITQGEKCLLLRCWAGCELIAITEKVGVTVKDLFFDGLPDPRKRREAQQRRATAQVVQRVAEKTRGRKNDHLRHAEYLIQSARGMTIDEWTPAQLDKRLNRLADAYDELWEEQYDQR